MKTLIVTIQTKANERLFHVVRFIPVYYASQCKVVITFESVDILKCNLPNKQYSLTMP